jgi:hypothetical protein
MLSKTDLRNAHIAIAVGMAVAFGGGYLVRNAGEGAMQLVGVAMLVATFGTGLLLLAREERREKRAKRDQ